MNKCFVLLLSVLVSSAIAQTPQLDHFKNLKARSIGPAGMSGRVTSIDVVLDQPEVIYVGTASGGIWKSESGGIRWTPIFDGQALQSIGALAIQQSNPDVVWAGTGEGNPRNSQTSGGGIYKSVNGGKTWQLMGLEKTITIHRIIVHRDNPDIVWVGATGSAWGDNSQRGVFKTTDGGKTWKKALYIDQRTGCADLVVDPSNPNKLYAAMWEYRRSPWFFTSGGPGSGMYVSFDGGETWKKRTEKNGLPKGELGRIGLAIAPSNPKIVYALVEAEKYGLYRSDDGGFNWHLQSDKNVGNRPFYYAELYVDPLNENRLYNLWSYVSLSEDGGKTFKTILDYGKGVHPDHHAFWVHPSNPNYLIEGNDGGLNISRDRGANWRFIENLPVAQFYHINTDNEIPYNIYGGMQDNGSWCGPAYSWKQGGIRNSDFQELLFGDGFDVVPLPNDSRYGYAMYQGGSVNLYDRNTGKTRSIRPVHPDNIKLRFNWNGAISIDPFKNDGLYFGSQFLHHSTDRGQTWEILSPDLTTNDPEKQKQVESGGLTIDATQAENHTTILSIAPSPKDQKTIWVGTDDGNLQVTTNGGKDWQNVYKKLKGAPKNGWIPQIHPSLTNAGEAFVVVNNYRQNDWNTYVYHTTDFGNKWTRIANGSQVNGYALSIVQDPKAPNLLFLGTENGLWISIDKGQNWAQWKHGFPSVSTMDLKIHARENDLVIGTFGRSAFVIDHINALRSYAKEGNELWDRPFKLFPINESYMASWKQASGTRFTADAHFKGQNRRPGVMMDFWLKELEKKEKVLVVITDQKGDTVRDFTIKPDTGINRIYWNFETNGERMPRRKELKKDANKPGGMSVKPGKYQVSLSYGEESDEASANVKTDPRAVWNEAAYDEKMVLLEESNMVVRAASEGMKRLVEAQKAIGVVNQTLLLLDDSTQSDIKKEGKRLTDSIKNLMKIYMVPEDFVGYDHVSIRLNDRLGAARNYIMSSEQGPNQMAKLTHAQAKAETEKVLTQINKFFETEWTIYQKMVEEKSVGVFKEYEKIKIDK